ncbi:hypothetical protein D1831_11975 [Lactiplantibacillus garii]|uniref:Integral membrane protein n=1 Tax=Lactiplantibacillus garii TaxID=2306423 RepID=A0A3R8KGV8_9LACO|nr:hypothetical protein [Lactiplantibacillus garii]RRK09587.1 hypothetical protein D1831_11975 [Lactiplantibacillus garii]
MQKFKSVSFWVANVIVSFGMASVMSTVTPLLVGAPLVWESTRFLILSTGCVALFSTTCLPLPALSRWLIHLFTPRELPLLTDVIFTIFITAIMATSAQVLMGQVQLVFWLGLAKIFPVLVVIAFFSVMLFKKLANLVVGVVEASHKPAL